MRKSVLWKRIHVRLSLAVCIALVASLAIAGCGGGGGGNNGGNNNGGGNNGGSNNGGVPSSSLAVVSGSVQDTSGNPVLGATVSIVGTALSGNTGSDGKFQINNVPLTAASFQVTSPTVTKYYNSGVYNGNRYSFGTDSSACVVALPAPLKAASVAPNPLPTPIILDIGGTNPPPPPSLNPPVGCPGHH